MKMSDVRVGMRLHPLPWIANSEGTVTVTALTERGFVYSLDAPRRVMPMLMQMQHGNGAVGK